MKKIFSLICVVVVALCIAGCGGDDDMNKPHNYIKISIDNIEGQLQRNAARAKNDWKGKYVEFSGRVGTIDSDGEYFVVNGYSSSFLGGIHCKIEDKKHKKKLMSVNEGQWITVKGKITYVGDVLGYNVKVIEMH